MSKEETLIIDPGHGGTDPGAQGFGQLEKDLTLKISLYQYKRFKELGANVSITRTKDTSLPANKRTAMIRSKYTYALSNHFNAASGKGSGVETIKSIHTKSKIADDLAAAIVSASGLPLRRVFTRSHPTLPGKDYYYMHRDTGTTNTVIVEYGFIDREKDNKIYRDDKTFFAVAEAVVKVYCKYLGVTYKAPTRSGQPAPKPSPAPKPTAPKPSEPAPSVSVTGKRVESVHSGNLRFYNKPSWKDRDVAGTLTKGYGFPRIIGQLTVDGAQQYKVQNSKGQVFYVTASPKYVKVVENKAPAAAKPKPKPSYLGKRAESIHAGTLRFYNKPSWKDRDVAGTLTKGYGFPRILDKVNVDGAQQYKVQNSKGRVFYVTASSKYVKVV